MEKHQTLSPAAIEDLKRKGFNQSEIAKMFGVTRQAVSKMKYTQSNFSRTPREIAMEAFPWTTTNYFSQASPFKRMRDHAEYMVTLGEGMSNDKIRRLIGFYDKLESEDVVLEYDPEIPPSEGIKTGGFAYRPREGSDGELMIRVNEYTKLTPHGEVLWCIPNWRPQIHEDAE